MKRKDIRKQFAIMIVISIFIFSSLNIEAQNSKEKRINEKGENFTHSVILELFVTTSCQYCPAAEEKAVELNYEYKSNFFFVTMVVDANDKANERSQHYVVETVPTAEFDGGYREDRTGNPDYYEGHIEDCGNRDTYSVDLEVKIEKADGNNINIGYTARYNDAIPPFFDCHLRVYIAEKVSRYINKEEKPIPYGFLDYAFDKDLRLVTQTEQSESTTWDASDCDVDNLVVIGAIFDKSTGTERYAVQSASTEKYANISISNITQNPKKPTSKDEVKVEAEINGTPSSVELEYSYCIEDVCSLPEKKNMSKEGEIYIGKMGPFEEGAEVHYRIIAKDLDGNEMVSPYYNFTVGSYSPNNSNDNEKYIYMGICLVLIFAICGVFIIKFLRK